MIEPVMEWLPPSCLESRAAVQPFGRLVDAWAADWFLSNAWSVLGAWKSEAESPAASWATLRYSPHEVAIQADDQAVLQLALDVLDAEPQQRNTEADLRLLRRFSAKILDDLEVRFSSLPRPTGSGTVGDESQYSLLVGALGRPMIALTCSARRLVPIIRTGFPRIHTAAPLYGALKACEDHVLDVSAILGKTRLRISDIRQFEVGDVVTLDQLSSQPIALAVSCRESSIRGHLGEQNGQVILEVADLK